MEPLSRLGQGQGNRRVPTALEEMLVGRTLGMPFHERSDLNKTKGERGSHDRLGPALLKYAFSSRIQHPIGRKKLGRSFTNETWRVRRELEVRNLSKSGQGSTNTSLPEL